jgi:hypothetical protein
MFINFGLSENPCQNYKTSMKDILASLNAIFRVLALFLKEIF